MSLSKMDLLNKKFSKSFIGYSASEVDQLMQELAEVLGSQVDKKKELKSRVAQLENMLGEHKQREETLRDTLITTQKMVDDLKATARKEAQLIIEQAQGKAENLLQQAHHRLGQIHEDISELKRQRTQFEMQLKGLLQTHMSILETTDPDTERVESMESKLKYLKKAK